MPRTSALALSVPLAVLALVAAGCGGKSTNSSGTLTESAGGGPGGKPVVVKLDEQNGSGESGTATLTAQGDATKVVLALENPAASTPQPAHIHKGSCDNLNPTPEYPLANVADGASTATVNVALDELDGGGFAINIHKSEPEVKTYVACGDIGKSDSSGGSDGAYGY